MKKSALLSILTIILLIAAGCTNNTKKESKISNENKENNANVPYEIKEAKSLKVSRIFGIGYPGNDHGLYIASNKGLKIYQEGKWYESTSNRHQYMGFQAIEEGFIASGKPQNGTDFKNPLGIVKSQDKGKSLEKIAFYGKANFHFMAAAYNGPALYVISEEPSEKLSLGVNYTKDFGESWKKSELKGFNADSLGMIAVHPRNADSLAMATRSGIYYSNDNGNTMKLVTEPLMVTALTFMDDTLLFSSVENEKIMLKSLNLKTGKQAAYNFPFLDYDNPITYLAVNPKNNKQLAFTTYKNDVYESTDSGNKWVNVLQEGKKGRD
ncbi:F510_1955 family glycosylhydrolase [Neobacillus kokaensis]|uniref:Sortilin N-terminal domain-containing protein n=1 Tax=Neobacillus kokaensis TaxID=2759023 RepID=A0ABQ3N0R7_9BACI|nr:hypothetical protein [Neobacillus kokaensis]GHH97083.1 hypothetical protein AM1BK_06260 [Neobacillus kokaensis]